MEVELRNKEENKEVSLGTSKANYMDPRITVACCVETNQCVGCYHFSAMARPSWLGRAARNRHAIEQASRRWRVGRHDDSARTRRKILISTQVIVTLITIGASKPVRNIISRRLRANSTSISKTGTRCSTT